MLDIVVYDSSKKFVEKNIRSINVALASYDVDYHIYRYDSYTDSLDSLIKNKGCNKIYILDAETMIMSGIDVASRIRKYDWNSIIIITFLDENYLNDIFYFKLMLLNYICKNFCYEESLVESIRTAISIINEQRMFIFKYNYVVYRIPYNQICYIEKEPVIKRCIIHTFDNEYNITGTMNDILNQLGNDFCRTHQSCIVNLNNIKSVNFSTHTIIFKNGDKTDMLTVKMKKELKKYVGLC